MLPQLRLIFCIAVFCALSASGAAAQLRIVHTGSTSRLIIFLHGLYGDESSSFRNASARLDWGRLMAADRERIRDQGPLSDFSIGYASYPSQPTSNLSLIQAAGGLRQNLRDTAALDAFTDVFFVTHSLGGIAIKQMLLDEQRLSERYLTGKVRGIVFLGTPSSGSNLASLVNALGGNVAGRLVEDLRVDNSFLANLDLNWRSLIARMPPTERPSLSCAFETRPLPVVGIVVPDLRSEQFCDGERRAFDRDHQTIAKPASEADEVYRWVRARILERLGAPTSAASRATERGAGGSAAVPTTRLPVQPKSEPKAPAPKSSPASSQERRARRVQVVDVVIGVEAFPDGNAIASQLQSGIATNLSELGGLIALPQPEIRQITNPIRFSVRVFPELGVGIGQKSVSFIVDITKNLDENDGSITQRVATNRKLESRLSIQCPVVFSNPCEVQPAERSRAETALARELLALLRRTGVQSTPRERAAQ